MKTYLWILLFLLCSCASNQRKFSVSKNRAFLFPLGTYRHEISVQPKGSEERNFQGIVQLKEDSITVVGLSHFGSTVFRINENRKTKKIDIEVFIDAMKKYKDKIREFYTVIHDFLNIKYQSALNLKGMTLEDYDENDIPKTIKIVHPNFTLTVAVVGYDV